MVKERAERERKMPEDPRPRPSERWVVCYPNGEEVPGTARAEPVADFSGLPRGCYLKGPIYRPEDVQVVIGDVVIEPEGSVPVELDERQKSSVRR